MRLVKAFLLSLAFCIATLANGRVETIRFQSKLINTTLPYNVILPADYATSRTTRYPVIYLLHGLTYWDRQVQEILKIASEKMRTPPAKRTSRA